MKKAEFLNKLNEELKKRNVPDAADILEEYEQHFDLKLADGFFEEEIAARLGDPAMLAAQFDEAERGPRKRSGSKPLTVIGLGIADVFAALRSGCAAAAAYQPAVFRQDEAPSAGHSADRAGAVRRLFRTVLRGLRPVRRKLPVLARLGLVCELRCLPCSA